MAVVTSSWYAPKPKTFTLTEKYYQECLEQAASFNTRIGIERRSRLPFLDSQTGVAQNPCNLWHPYHYRSKAASPTQLYQYPAKRWRKRKRAFQIQELNVNKTTELETGDADMHQINTVENPAAIPEISMLKEPEEASKEHWYDEMDVLSEPMDAGEIDERNSDSSDYEKSYQKMRKKKKGGGKKKAAAGRGRGRTTRSKAVEEEVDEKEKPYACDMCGARYKTRPGLTYHLTHTHSGVDVDEESMTSATGTSAASATTPLNGRSSPRVASAPPTPSSTSNKDSSVNNYCDFCLGDETENKKTGTQEELVSCADCGRSGHPSCLQFTANMIISVKKYPWQCIECKSCGLCGTSDNDDQLLFCDDCDRGYHMYCLNPPLSEPPEGSWSCHLCIQEFYGGKKPPGML